MKAIVLVGGKGTRLAPLTDTRAKPMLPIANVPFIERTLNRLAAAGCDEVVLSGFYLAEAFKHLETLRDIDVRVEIEDEPLGTGGAIRFAGRNFDETFVVFNGDILADVDLAAEVGRHREFGGEATVLLTPVDDPLRFGVVLCAPDNRVIQFIEKPAPGTVDTNLINAGIYVCEPAMLERIDPDGPVSVEREIFPQMAEQNVLYGVRFDGYWLDFGTLETYLVANRDTLAGLVAEPIPGEKRGSRIWVAESADISRGKIEGPVVVGEGCRFGNGASIGPSVAIGANCVIGDGATIRDSVVLDGAHIGDNAVVDGLIVGYGATIRPRSPSGDRLVVGPGEVL